MVAGMQTGPMAGAPSVVLAWHWGGGVKVVKGILPNMYCLKYLWILATPGRGLGVTNF